MSEIWQMGAVQLAQYIRERKLSSREVVEALIRRIESGNLTVLLAEEALVAWPTV